MKVVSKFLTADVEIVAVRIEGRRVVVEGLVKGFMPMTMETDLSDLGRVLRLAARPFRERLAELLPRSLGEIVSPPVSGTESP